MITRLVRVGVASSAQAPLKYFEPSTCSSPGIARRLADPGGAPLRRGAPLLVASPDRRRRSFPVKFHRKRRTNSAKRLASALVSRLLGTGGMPVAQHLPLPPLFAALAMASCALTAPVAGGPVRAHTVTQLQPSWALAYGRASANLGGARVRGNAQTFGGPLPWGAPIPIRLGVRQALGSVVEASGDLGWVDAGLELRAARRKRPGSSPWRSARGSAAPASRFPHRIRAPSGSRSIRERLNVA